MSNIVLLADDMSLIFKVNRKDTNLVETNNTLNLISDYFSANNLFLKAGKTKCGQFLLPNVASIDTNVRMDGKILELVPSTVLTPDCNGGHI